MPSWDTMAPPSTEHTWVYEKENEGKKLKYTSDCTKVLGSYLSQ